MYWLAQEVALAHLPLYDRSGVNATPCGATLRYRHQRDWRTLLYQARLLTAAGDAIPCLAGAGARWNAPLDLTGGLTLAPSARFR